jgi:thymidylate kinase
VTPAWVVLEGADGVGKSTLAAALAQRLSYEHGPTVLQSLRQHSAEREYCSQPTMWHLRGLNVVQDRSLLSRLAYQPVVLVPGAERKDLEEAKRTMASMREKVAVLYLHCEEGELAYRIRARGDAYFHPSLTGELLKSYWRTMAWWESAGGWSATVDVTEAFCTVDEALLALSTAPTVNLGPSRSSLIR